LAARNPLRFQSGKLAHRTHAAGTMQPGRAAA
jgi:hypothetical protein